MKDLIFDPMYKSLRHLETLHECFINEENFDEECRVDYDLYKYNNEKLACILRDLQISKQLYSDKDRQMILADLYEYIFLGRGYYSMKKSEDRSKFIRAILHFVNLLMCYETIVASPNLRNKFLEDLSRKIPEIKNEKDYDELLKHNGVIGLPIRDLKKELEKNSVQIEKNKLSKLNKYFDSMLPKTAGGLWHELVVYAFLLRNDVGYIIPLLLSQRLFGLNDHIIPPDFLVISYDKRIYGIEVGTKKEIQSGAFTLKTGIPTATLDTENSRVSDRCPICKRWILFCDFVIEKYSNLEEEITKREVRCLKECDIYSEDEIASGKCPYTKYSRNMAKTLDYTHHKFSDGRHYHYTCVLKSVSEDMRNKIINAKDEIALKTHYPYYSGIEELLKERTRIRSIEQVEKIEERLEKIEAILEKLTRSR